MKYKLSVKRDRKSENLPELYVNGKHVGILDAVSFLYEMVEEYQKRTLNETEQVTWIDKNLPVKALDQHGVKYICLNETDTRAVKAIIVISKIKQSEKLQQVMSRIDKWLQAETESGLQERS